MREHGFTIEEVEKYYAMGLVAVIADGHVFALCDEDKVEDMEELRVQFPDLPKKFRI